MLLLVGLGNPGPRYAFNRHNVGFMALDAIVGRYSFAAWRTRFQALAAEGRIGDLKVLALKPTTFMNESGRAVGEALRFYKLEPEQVIVLYDEIDLRPGKVKVKRGGGAGGHNGIRSLDAHIGRDYWRVRLGVGHPGHKDLVHGYVLHDFAKAEHPGLKKLLDAVAAEWPLLLARDPGAFMSRVAHVLAPPRPKPPPQPESRPESPAKADPPEAPSASESGDQNGP